MIYLYLVLSGLLGGFFGGMGMGGGTLLIPILTIFLGIDQKLAQGINLISFLVMAIFSLFIHRKNNLVKTRHIFIIIITGLIFSGLGAFLITKLSSDILRKAFGVFLCVLAVCEIIKLIKKSH